MKVMCVFGTRPEAIKFAPIIHALNMNANVSSVVCVTSQHREMLNQVLDTFGIIPDINLDIMQPGQDLFQVTTAVINGLSTVIGEVRPDYILVQGDTSTTFAAALAAFYCRVPVGHIEAGLRTYNKHSPFPEEVNRRMTTVIADDHFAPTFQAKENLLKENISIEHIWITGNTSIDALYWMASQIEKDDDLRQKLQSQFLYLDPTLKTVLVTAHRRENFGNPLEEICLALCDVAQQVPQVQIVYPLHPNPNVRQVVSKILTAQSLPNIHLIEPVDYASLVYLLKNSMIVVTDSGGIQEEAPSLGKPVLITRETTERPEAVEAGISKIVGTSRDAIRSSLLNLLEDQSEYYRIARPCHVYGNGKAAQKILDVLQSTYL